MSQSTDVSALFSAFPEKTFKKGSLLIQPMDKPDGVYFIQSGNVREYAVSQDGIEVTIHIFSPQSFFPLTWALNNITNRYYYEAMNTTKVYVVPQDEVVHILKSHPEVLYSLTTRLLSGLDKLSLRIEGLSFDGAFTRIISTLLFLVRHFGEKKGESVLITEAFTHKTIATLAGISRETTSRVFQQLEKLKLISYDQKYICIPNITALEKALE